MAANWEYPEDSKITGATKIKEADNKIQNAMNDLVKWTNNSDEYAVGGTKDGQGMGTTVLNSIVDVEITSVDNNDSIRYDTSVSKFVNTKVYSISEVNALISAAVPIGVIQMWSGVISSIPAGFALCDGTNGTPNLVGRFVFGRSDDSNDTGGSKDAVSVYHTHNADHTHPDSTAQYNGAHDHAQRYRDVKENADNSTDGDYYQTKNGTLQSKDGMWNDGAHQHTTYTPERKLPLSAGVSGVGKNMPPYMELAYIMKVS